MKLMLDENVTLKAEQLFNSFGYDVISVQSLGLKGISDEQVFSIAQTQNRVLITHNGKHFIIQIPPKMKDISHEGLLWLKYQLKRTNAEQVCTELDKFFKSLQSIANSIWVYKKPNQIIRYYPK